MSAFHRQFKRIPHWVTADYSSILHLQENIRDWLLDSASLTLRIKQHCQSKGMGCFSVKVIRQGMGIPSNDEVQRLKLQSRRYALMREVLLLCGETPVIFARTVIPIKTLTGPQRQLARLGNRPLGEFLFSQPELQRDTMEVSVISQGHQLYDSAVVSVKRAIRDDIEQGIKGAVENKAHYSPKHIWARRSVFCLRHKPLLVAEVFLPDILQRSSHHTFVAPVLTGSRR